MKKKHTLFAAVLLLLLYFNVTAQQTKISDMQTPPSPAFVLFGAEPNSITPPSTPRAVAASFLTSIMQGGAFEFAPYWLSSHPKLTFDQYYNADVGESILQTLSVSFATIPKTGSEDIIGTRAGLGLRCLIIPGRPSEELKTLRSELSKKQLDFLNEEDSVKQKKIEAELKTLSLSIQKEDHNRIGFSLAFASAASMNFLNDNFSKGKFDKWGVWLTASYIWNDPSFNILAVARLLGSSKVEGTQNVLDIGCRAVAGISNFSLSLEYIQRTQLDIQRDALFANIKSSNFFLKNTFRLAGNIEYKYNSDVSVFITFGKNYSNEKEDTGSLIAQVGFNLGLGSIPLIN